MSAPQARPLTPQEWMAGAEYPWPGIPELAEGQVVVACYRVTGAQLGTTKHDKPYLMLQLSDRSGTIEGRVWEEAERAAKLAPIGGYVGIRARVERYRQKRQLRIEELHELVVPAEELGIFLPTTRRDVAEMACELDSLIASIEDAPLRALTQRLLGPDSETGRAFRGSPAAKTRHHAHLGGLLEHTLSIAFLCQRLAEHYGAIVDRDLLLAGALLHDIGKVREISTEPGFPYTDEGKLLGHIVLGLDMVLEAAAEVPELSTRRLLLLRHLIASHQGRYEWQSPREPLTLEGLLLHFADDLDAKMNQAIALLEGIEEGWSPYDRAFGREFLRHAVGLPAVPAGAGGSAARPRAPRRGRPGAGSPPPPHTATAAAQRSGPPEDDTLDMFGD